MIDKYFLILNECLSSLGNSLVLRNMLVEFLRTITKKTTAISSIALDRRTHKTIASINKKSMGFKIEQFICTNETQSYKIKTLESKEKIILLYFHSVIILIKYAKELQDIDKVANLIFSMEKKINSSIEACRIFEENQYIKERLELASEGANDGLWDWDIINDKVYFSSRWKSMIGYEDHEISNSFYEWESRIHPEDKQNAISTVHRYLSQEIESFENIHRLKHKQGHWIWILDRGKAIFTNGKAQRFVGFHTDITQQKTLESQLEDRVAQEVKKNQEKDLMLRQQSRLAQLGEMISMIAHQWRQPLASISSVAIALKIKIALERFSFNTKKDQEEFLSSINEKMDDIDLLVQHLTKTIDDFRTFYKPDKESKLQNINHTIEKALKLTDQQLIQNSIKIKTVFHANKKIEIFENELLQVFLNIIKNALDNFQEKKTHSPTLYISTHDKNDLVIIKIEDNGGGISKDIIEKIFDPYFSTKDKKNGTGLGLYMSKLIIEQHHKGSLSALNIENGASFTIEI